MRRLFALVILVSLAMVYPMSVKGERSYTCDTCHSHAGIYSSHLEGGKYCSRCHGEIHEIHSMSCEVCHLKKPLTILCHSAPSDARILTSPPEKYSVCENCHINIVEVHQGNCQMCHLEDVNKIHANANRR
ncbi:hypothetical protein [Thermosphaera sp.]